MRALADDGRRSRGSAAHSPPSIGTSQSLAGSAPPASTPPAPSGLGLVVDGAAGGWGPGSGGDRGPDLMVGHNLGEVETCLQQRILVDKRAFWSCGKLTQKIKF